MFSMPPAIVQLAMPLQISMAALATAWAPEPQTRLTVRAGTSTGSPPPMPAWRAGVHLAAGLDDMTHHQRLHFV
jgi:hypothetical protein